MSFKIHVNIDRNNCREEVFSESFSVCAADKEPIPHVDCQICNRGLRRQEIGAPTVLSCSTFSKEGAHATKINNDHFHPHVCRRKCVVGTKSAADAKTRARAPAAALLCRR